MNCQKLQRKLKIAPSINMNRRARSARVLRRRAGHDTPIVQVPPMPQLTSPRAMTGSAPKPFRAE
jgi:hypothetical protein